jgi:hypothetical protein
MGCTVRYGPLRDEQAALTIRLSVAPPAGISTPPGETGVGPCSIRMLLTWLSLWRGGAGFLHPGGIWPRWIDGHSGPIFELGPALGPRYPLLTDPQIVRLLCEGCPFARPPVDLLGDFLAELELDEHDSAARMRAIFSAHIFFEWRDGAHDWGQRTSVTRAMEPGFGCRLAHCRASMGRLIAGLSVNMIRQDGGELAGTPLDYGPGVVPGDGFLPFLPPTARAPTPPADAAGPDPGPAPPRRGGRRGYGGNGGRRRRGGQGW